MATLVEAQPLQQPMEEGAAAAGAAAAGAAAAGAAAAAAGARARGELDPAETRAVFERFLDGVYENSPSLAGAVLCARAANERLGRPDTAENGYAALADVLRLLFAVDLDTLRAKHREAVVEPPERAAESPAASRGRDADRAADGAAARHAASTGELDRAAEILSRLDDSTKALRRACEEARATVEMAKHAESQLEAMFALCDASGLAGGLAGDLAGGLAGGLAGVLAGDGLAGGSPTPDAGGESGSAGPGSRDSSSGAGAGSGLAPDAEGHVSRLANFELFPGFEMPDVRELSFSRLNGLGAVPSWWPPSAQTYLVGHQTDPQAADPPPNSPNSPDPSDSPASPPPGAPNQGNQANQANQTLSSPFNSSFNSSFFGLGPVSVISSRGVSVIPSVISPDEAEAFLSRHAHFMPTPEPLQRSETIHARPAAPPAPATSATAPATSAPATAPSEVKVKTEPPAPPAEAQAEAEQPQPRTIENPSLVTAIATSTQEQKSEADDAMPPRPAPLRRSSRARGS